MALIQTKLNGIFLLYFFSSNVYIISFVVSFFIIVIRKRPIKTKSA